MRSPGRSPGSGAMRRQDDAGQGGELDALGPAEPQRAGDRGPHQVMRQRQRGDPLPEILRHVRHRLAGRSAGRRPDQAEEAGIGILDPVIELPQQDGLRGDIETGEPGGEDLAGAVGRGHRVDMQVEHPAHGAAAAVLRLEFEPDGAGGQVAAGQDAPQRDLERLARRRHGLPEVVQRRAFRQAEQLDQGRIGAVEPQPMPHQAKADRRGGIERLQGDALLLRGQRSRAAFQRPRHRPAQHRDDVVQPPPLSRRSKAPARIACATSSRDASPVSRTTSTARPGSRAAMICSARAMPLSPGILISVRTTAMSGAMASCASASSALPALRSRKPDSASPSASSWRSGASSSTTRTQAAGITDATRYSSRMG